MREIEITMIVCGHKPQAVLEEICALEWIGRYRVLPRAANTIRDHYFDLPDNALRTQRLALRVREISGCQWLTLKGAARVTDLHAVRRAR
ncbi:MAG: CYTH domain-containing protein [Acidiferrobacterales bacterium]